MTTPGGNDPYSGHGESDPFGTGSGDSYGSTPPPPPPPGGTNPYGGAPNPYGGAPGSPGGSTDGVSIAALVTAALCCTGPVAIVLGIIGLVRTKGGRRRGRWMAVVGLVGGVLATVVLAGLGVAVVWFGQQAVTVNNAEAGQCVDVQESGDTVLMFEKDCTEEHDAEIVHAGEYDESADAAAHGPDGALNAAICVTYLSAGEIAALEEAGLQPGDLIVIAEDPDNMSDGDRYTCYVDPDRKLTEPLL